MAAALIDRLVHHCHLVTIRGNSYRMRQHRALANAARTKNQKPPRAAGGAPASGRDELRLVPSSICQHLCCDIFGCWCYGGYRRSNGG
jgi:hypothetical protein